MNRRSFLLFLGVSPLVGWGVVKASPAAATNMTATEVKNRIAEHNRLCAERYGVHLDGLLDDLTLDFGANTFNLRRVLSDDELA